MAEMETMEEISRSWESSQLLDGNSLESMGDHVAHLPIEIP